MGAKQSKRSVDISGKEAESAGEVAAAGAGGEGRVEPLADADALKPHLNGDAHIHEQTDKEKQLDSGTPENEKDATTEKEGKQEEPEKEKEAAPVTNGDSAEPKTENGDSAPTPEETKKPKKEKVKKKWSLRSISFSRKDKPKQEKKQKEEETKTNGEPEKVPEEAPEVSAELTSNDVAEVKSETEAKEEKTPETPVTEPITNGSNTPESPKVEIPLVEEVISEAAPEPTKTEPVLAPEPEKLPINGLSLEEPKSDLSEVAQIEESKPEEIPVESTDTAPAIEIPVPKEVCVEQMPVIESTPPPLPANPPPSSVVSFAATTMAPDLTDASLVNTAENAISTPPVLDTKPNLPKECPTEQPHTDLTNKEAVIPSPLTKPIEEIVQTSNDTIKENLEAPVTVEAIKVIPSEPINDESEMEVKSEVTNGVLSNQIESPIGSNKLVDPMEPELPPPPPLDDNIEDLPEPVDTIPEEPTEHVEVVSPNFSNGDIVNGIDNKILNGNTEIEQENVNNKAVDSLGNYVQTIECNGNINEVKMEMKQESGREPSTEESIAKAASPEESLPPSPSEGEAGAGEGEAEASDSFPAPPSECRSPSDGSPEPESEPQEPVVVSDKIADLIPEVPVVPDLNTETLQETTDVAVVN